jgi:hypothetical protein
VWSGARTVPERTACRSETFVEVLGNVKAVVALAVVVFDETCELEPRSAPGGILSF